MTLYFNRVHNSPLWPYETTKKLNSLNTKVMNNVNIKFKKAKNVLSILKRSGEIYSNLHMIKKLKYFKVINYEKNKSSKKQKKKAARREFTHNWTTSLSLTLFHSLIAL